MKRIVIVGPAYPYRGGQALVEAHLFDTLSKADYECYTVSFTLLYPKIFFPGTSQYDESDIHFYEHDNKIFRIINSINPFTWWKAYKKIKALKADAVVFVWWMPFFGPAYSTIAFLLKYFLKIKIVFLVENYISHENRWLDKLSSKITLDFADYFICQSTFVKQNIRKNHKHTPIFQTTLSVFDCYDLKQYNKATAKAKLGIKTEKVILFFGLIRAYKGLDQLLYAFPSLKSLYPDSSLLVVGECYEDISKYKKIIAKENIENSVILVNKFIPNEVVEPYFKAADVVCLPYYSATQSGILMMAYGFRVPVVTTNVGGLSELVEQGKTGLILDNNEPKKIVDGISRIFESDENFEKNIEQLSESLGYKTLKTIFIEVTT